MGPGANPKEWTEVAAWLTDLDPHVAPDLSHSALLVIDTQVDFVDGGASPIAGTSQVVPVIAGLLQAFRAAGLPVVHVVRLYDGTDVDLPRRSLIDAGAPIVRPGSPGSQIAPPQRAAAPRRRLCARTARRGVPPDPTGPGRPGGVQLPGTAPEPHSTEPASATTAS